MPGILGLERSDTVPPEIDSPAKGRKVIAAIRQATTPYAILTMLDAMPPKEED